MYSSIFLSVLNVETEVIRKCNVDMELHFFGNIRLVCNHKSVNFLSVIRLCFQTEPHSEHTLRSVCAGSISNNSLSITYKNAHVIGHIDGIGTRLNLIANGLTLEEVQREHQVRDLAAFAQQLEFGVRDLYVLFALRAEILKGNHRNNHFLQADAAMHIILAATGNLDASSIARSETLYRNSIDLSGQLHRQEIVSFGAQIGNCIPATKLIDVSAESCLSDLLTFRKGGLSV